MSDNKDDIDLDGWDLHRAANNVDIVRALIARGDDVEARDDYGRTPLHQAAWENSTEVARLLIENGADVDATDRSGVTPLHESINIEAEMWTGQEVVRLLIEHGADIDASTDDGKTPLHLTLHSGDEVGSVDVFPLFVEVARLLIEKGANTDGIDLS